MLTARALLVRLRVVVLVAWLAPLALFSSFAALAPLPPRDATEALFGPATISALVGWAIAAAIWLPRIVWHRCVRVRPNEMVHGLRTLSRTTVAMVWGSILFACTIAFYSSGMHVLVRPSELVALATCGVLYAVLLAVPLYLAGADLLGRYFGPRLHGAALLPLAWRDAALAGGIAIAGALALVFCAVVTGAGVRVDVAFAACALVAFSGVAARLAYRGTVHAVAPLHALCEAVSAERVEPASLDTIGTLVADLAQARSHDRSIVRDVEDRVARMRMFAESTTDYFFELDRDLRVSFVSDRFVALTGLPASQILGSSVVDAVNESTDPDAKAHLRQLLDHRPYRGHRFVQVTADGRSLHLQTSAVPYLDARGEFAGYRGCGTDVTAVVEAQRQLRRKEAELTQAQKMEAVGQLTGGVAHDFNNLLSALAGNLELLKLKTEGDATCQRYIESALAATTRGASLTKRLLAFSRRQALSPRNVDVAALLDGMADLLLHTMGERVVVNIEAAAELDGCVIDPHQLESAVLNIAINARDAMPDGGCIGIAADNFTQRPQDVNGDLAPGRYVRIAITDDGDGIPEDVLPHVFEPFFTTKEPGRGSGLGLSMVYGFVQQSGGHIDVKSKVGHGTTVTIYLPGVGLPARECRALQGAATHTVLVVEDDPLIVEDALRRLRDDGYRVLSALDADEAMRVLDAESVDVVLIDAVLPDGMSGVDLAERLSARHARVHTMLMVGRALGEAERSRTATIGASVLCKPVDLHELSWRVASALAYGRRSSNELSAPAPRPPH